ncbi:hypothetical protein EDC04DRAFT_2664104 [Pisolithus marmoratus]|nr:hypothetical protein EDC04DRAFT_2664104 [Pisolithus marmoratus]
MTSVEARHLAAAWSGQVLFDALVFTLTLRKLISARSLGRRTFTALSLRDGALFFAYMSIVCDAHDYPQLIRNMTV